MRDHRHDVARKTYPEPPSTFVVASETKPLCRRKLEKTVTLGAGLVYLKLIAKGRLE